MNRGGSSMISFGANSRREAGRSTRLMKQVLQINRVYL